MIIAFGTIYYGKIIICNIFVNNKNVEVGAH